MSMPKPNWHAPWKLFRVISGHTGWVRCAAVEPGNEWFATGAADRVIKIWDLASGKLKLSLTGHISTVRGLVVSPRQPYLVKNLKYIFSKLRRLRCLNRIVDDSDSKPSEFGWRLWGFKFYGQKRIVDYDFNLFTIKSIYIFSIKR